ncbi:MAG: N-acetylmuramoyl-L-alanine amidase [Gemmatimonadota bacterium]|nr:N-acetylmuramoyl-L-alanine amidase [Gemmatimonadota bacterium]
MAEATTTTAPEDPHMRIKRSSRCVLTAVALVGAILGPGGVSAQDRPIVVIDAGHGGDEAGVVHGDILEKDVILRLAFNMAAEFVRNGFDVRLTRTGDYALAWDDRRAVAEEAGADLLLMLHAMGKDDPAIHGAEVYFFEEDAESSMAARLTGEALEAGGTTVTSIPKPWPFLQSPTVPTVMIELGHLSNPLELRSLMSDDYHRQLARALMEVTEALTGDR